MAHIKDSIVISSNPEKAHIYVAKVDKWATWFTALGRVNGADGEGDPGTVVRQTYSLIGKDIDFTSTITENRARGDGGYVWRAKRAGEFTGTHSLDFTPQDGKTLVTSDLEYEIEAGLFGKAADHLGAKAAIEHSVRHALQALKELAEEDWVVGLEETEEVWPRTCDS